jgi:hypothetical protein
LIAWLGVFSVTDGDQRDQWKSRVEKSPVENPREIPSSDDDRRKSRVGTR